MASPENADVYISFRFNRVGSLWGCRQTHFCLFGPGPMYYCVSWRGREGGKEGRRVRHFTVFLR